MSSSVRLRKKPSKICLGDMDTVINIYKRDLNCPKDVKYGLNLSLKRENVWCKWDVVGKGIEIFDNVSQQVSVATDIITIHNDPEFRTFDFLEFENNLYQILASDYLDQKNKEFCVLYCVMKGSKDKKVTLL